MSETPQKNPVFVGIEILHTPGRTRRAFVYASLDDSRKLIAIGHGDRNEILAYLGGQQQALAAINAPRRTNMGVVNQAAVYQNVLPLDKPTRRINARLCEYLLHEEGFNVAYTPDKSRRCPGWVRRGFDLYRRLQAFGYQAYPNGAAPGNGPPSTRCTLETLADAIFWRFLDRKLPLPDSLEGRLQRQLILYEIGLPVADAMDFFLEITRHKLIRGELPDGNIHTFAELNALAAALLAWQAAHQPESLELLGNPEEGQLALPRKER
jgi:hypothetical protein